MGFYAITRTLPPEVKLNVTKDTKDITDHSTTPKSTQPEQSSNFNSDGYSPKAQFSGSAGNEAPRKLNPFCQAWKGLTGRHSYQSSSFLFCGIWNTKHHCMKLLNTIYLPPPIYGDLTPKLIPLMGPLLTPTWKPEL